MAPSSNTLNYDAVLSTTLFNYRKELADCISTANAFFWLAKKNGIYKTLEANGDRMHVPLMYELGNADSYAGYDVLDTTPADGITSAFFNWAQASVPISISGAERKKNRGEAQIVNLLDAKTKQAMMGIQEFFSKCFLQGAGGSSITTAYTSPTNGSTFVDPLPLLVKYDPTTSTTIGNLNQSTYSWWQNKKKTSTATTLKGFLQEVRNLNNSCSLGPGGKPDLWFADQNYYELYVLALSVYHMNTSAARADLPFENVAILGSPLTFDEFVPNASGGSATQSTAAGTCYALNTKFIDIQVDSATDFSTTPMVTPNDQDASTAHILWYGGIGMSNRRKHGVHGAVDTTIVA